MIKLFYCPDCNRHMKSVTGTALIRTSVGIFPDGDYYLDGEDCYAADVTDAIDFVCHEDSSHIAVKVVEIEQCPHEWRIVPNAWKPTRRCVLCGMDDEGEVIWND